MEIGMLNFWLELLVTAQTKENYFSNRIEKLHKMAFIIFFWKSLKKFEKVEKTGIISTKFSLRCTPSVILGVHLLNCELKQLITLPLTTMLLLLSAYQSFDKGFWLLSVARNSILYFTKQTFQCNNGKKPNGHWQIRDKVPETIDSEFFVTFMIAMSLFSADATMFQFFWAEWKHKITDLKSSILMAVWFFFFAARLPKTAQN